MDDAFRAQMVRGLGENEARLAERQGRFGARGNGWEV